MKKLITLIVVVCLLFGGTVAYLNDKQNSNMNIAENIDEGTSETFYDEIYSKYDPNMVVMSVGGNEVTWGEYFYWFYNFGSQVEQMMMYYPLYYGTEISWDDVYNGSTGTTYYDLPAESVESQLKMFAAIGKYAADNGHTFSEESEEKYQENLQETMQQGEFASEEEMFEALRGIYVTKEVFDHEIRSNLFAQQMYKETYGENGNKVTDEDAIAYLQDNGYTNVMHILISKYDNETGEELNEEEYSAKVAVAEEICKQINEIEDPVKKVETFKTLQEQYNEDGYTQYTFKSGEMIQSFEDKAKELKEYEIGMIESDYGTHIILKLPLDPDFTLSGLEQTARAAFADNDMNNAIIEIIDGMEIEYLNGFEIPDLRKYI